MGDQRDLTVRRTSAHSSPADAASPATPRELLVQVDETRPRSQTFNKQSRHRLEIDGDFMGELSTKHRINSRHSFAVPCFSTSGNHFSYSLTALVFSFGSRVTCCTRTWESIQATWPPGRDKSVPSECRLQALESPSSRAPDTERLPDNLPAVRHSRRSSRFQKVPRIYKHLIPPKPCGNMQPR